MDWVVMKSIFLDCNDQLAPVWARVIRPDDPKIDINRESFAREELPLVLAGYDIAIDDHSYMPTELVARCKQLKHIVFLGTGAASYMNLDELKAHGVTVHTIKGYGTASMTGRGRWRRARHCAGGLRMTRQNGRGFAAATRRNSSATTLPWRPWQRWRRSGG